MDDNTTIVIALFLVFAYVILVAILSSIFTWNLMWLLAILPFIKIGNDEKVRELNNKKELEK